jgi:protein O-GlcNAc transferase
MSTKIQELIGEAISLYQNGFIVEAEESLLKVLKAQKNNLPAFEILGLIKATSGDHIGAAKYLKKAVQINPNNFSTRYNLAKALADCNEHIESIPHHERAVKLAPLNLDAWINYGKSLAILKKNNAALSAFNEALKINPEHIESRLNRGIALRGLGSVDDALLEFKKIVGQEPNNYLAIQNLGLSYLIKKQYQESLNYLNQAYSLNPNDVTLLLAKGQALFESKRYGDAILVSEEILKIDLNSCEALSNIGSALNELNQPEDAINYFDKALALNPMQADAYSNKGLAYSKLKRLPESLESYNKAYGINPNIDFLLGSKLNVKMLIGDRNNIEKETVSLIQALAENKHVIAPFGLMSLVDSPSAHLQAATIWAKTNAHIQELEIAQKIRPVGNRKIKLAYISADFKNHPVSHLTAELFELHNRDQFELYAISLVKASGNDAMRKRLENAFDHFIDVENKSDPEIAEFCRNLGIDISIDLGGYTEGARTDIFKFRVAPIQVNYLGYPGSLGTESFDYIIADKIVIPEQARNFFTEKIAYLPDCFMVDDSKRLPSASPMTRKEFGLPENAFVFCCFNNSYKLNSHVIQTWSNILNAVAGSVLWLSENNVPFQQNLITEFAQYGIKSSRIIFANRVELISDHLKRHQLADLFLDTYPFNAHTTAIDSLKSGLPLITILGDSFPARVAGSLLATLSLPELITNNFQEYEELAIHLGNNPSKVILLKEKLTSHLPISPLFNTKLFASNLESLLTEMQRRHENDEPVSHILT